MYRSDFFDGFADLGCASSSYEKQIRNTIEHPGVQTVIHTLMSKVQGGLLSEISMVSVQVATLNIPTKGKPKQTRDTNKYPSR